MKGESLNLGSIKMLFLIMEGDILRKENNISGGA